MSEPAGTRPHCSIEQTVRYAECDPMGYVHHAVYPIWMEIARTELLRQRGESYRQMEEQGVRLVVARMSLRYKRPARYDDTVRIHVEAEPSRGTTLDHAYRLTRDGVLLVEAQTTLACIDESGGLQRIPSDLLALHNG